MKQCTNCKCQVGSGVVICPYCNAYLPEPVQREPGRRTTTPVVVQRYSTRETSDLNYYAPPLRYYDPVQTTGGRLAAAAAIPAKPKTNMPQMLLLVAACLLAANLMEIAALLLMVL